MKKKISANNETSLTPIQYLQAKDFQLKDIQPLSINQAAVMAHYQNGKNLVLHGFAGTGKTYLAMWLALKDLLTQPETFCGITIIRSVVQGRNMGFLPGDEKKKASKFEEPYKQIVDDLFGNGSGYDVLKQKQLVKFRTTSFLRGITIDNTILVVDEIQNMNYQELSTIMTRLGDGSKVVFCGDYRQSDLGKVEDVMKFMSILRSALMEKYFAFVEFEKCDIVRSPIVRDFIISENDYIDNRLSELNPLP